MDTYNLITLGMDHVTFDRKVELNAQDLIRNLCRWVVQSTRTMPAVLVCARDVPADRLGNTKDGTKALKSHRWFRNFSWSNMVAQTMPPPFLPALDDEDHTKYVPWAYTWS